MIQFDDPTLAAAAAEEPKPTTTPEQQYERQASTQLAGFLDKAEPFSKRRFNLARAIGIRFGSFTEADFESFNATNIYPQYVFDTTVYAWLRLTPSDVLLRYVDRPEAAKAAALQWGEENDFDEFTPDFAATYAAMLRDIHEIVMRRAVKLHAVVPEGEPVKKN